MNAAAAKKKKKAPVKATPHRETFRLVPLVGMISLGFLLVLGSRARGGVPVQPMDLLPWAIWIASCTVVSCLFRLQKFSGPGSMVGGIWLLSGIGMLLRTRMSGYTGTDLPLLQLLVLPLGMLWLWLFWSVTRLDRAQRLQALGGVSLLFSLLLVGAIAALGTRYRGAAFAPGNLTPTELLKLLIPLGLAALFAAHPKAWVDRPVWRMSMPQVIKLLAYWGLLAVLLAWQRDLGLLVLLSLLLVVLLLAYTRRASWGLLMLLLASGAGWAIWQFAEHGNRRLQAWLDPFADPTGAGWQMLQGMSGLYAGGLFGTGLGEGRPDRIPIAASDFVYAVLGEETGFIGCLLVVFLYVFLLRWGLTIARRQNDDFRFLLALGLTASLGAQIFVNIAGVVGLLPITGITLPYLSQGGSSFWVTSIQFGMLLGLSESRVKKAGKKKAASRKRNR